MLFCGRKRKHKFHIVQALLAVTLLLLLSFVQNANAKEQENGEEIYETEIGELEQSTEETEDTEDVDNTEENKIAFFSQTYGSGTISLGSYNGGGTISLTEDVTPPPAESRILSTALSLHNIKLALFCIVILWPFKSISKTPFN